MKINNIKILQYCYGCGVCTSICNKNIIKLALNQDGFYQPTIIDINKCTNCGLCLEVCSFYNNSPIEKKQIKAFTTYSKEQRIRKEASSGGTGYEIAHTLLEKGTKIIAVKYNSLDNRAEHYISDSIKDLKASIGSKYIQSYTENVFKQIRKNEKYLITGTPCQIASMRRFIRIKRIEENVVLIDFFCHGIPSKLMWDKYLSEKSKTIGAILNVSWRNKENGWHDSWVMSIIGSQNKYTKKRSEGDIFYKFFLENQCLNKSCYEDCKFKNLNSEADIRIGDLWGSKYIENEEGLTGVLTLTDKGEQILNAASNYITIEPESIETITEEQMKNRIHQPYYYPFVMFLLRTPLKLSQIYFIIRILKLTQPSSIKKKLKLNI